MRVMGEAGAYLFEDQLDEVADAMDAAKLLRTLRTKPPLFAR